MSTSAEGGATDLLTAEPTDQRFESKRRGRVLRPWTETESSAAEHGRTKRFSQVPFLAAPEGFDSEIKSDARYHGFVSGWGAGKTTAGIIRSVMNVELWNPGELGMIVGPTVPHIKNAILPEMRRWGLLDHWEFKGKGSDEPGLIAENGARVILESADNDRKIERLQGPSLAWFWIDEAAQLPHRVWEIAVSRLRTGQYRNGYITTTPQGFNWVYDRFYGEGEGPPDDVNLIYGVPSYVNPELPSDYRDITDEFTGHVREQSVLGRFVQPEGLVFPAFDDVPILPVEEPGDGVPENPRRVFYGVDFGFTNPSAILAVIETRTGELYVVEEFFERRCNHNDLADVANTMQGRWGEGVFYCDPSEPDAIETFQRAGINAVPANNEVVSGIRTVSQTLEDVLVRETCSNFINEMSQYHYDDESEDEEPVKMNDHAVDAFRYAIHTDAQGGLSIGVVEGDDLYG